MADQNDTASGGQKKQNFLCNKAKSPASPVFKGQRPPPHFSAAAGMATQKWRGTEIPVHFRPAKAGAGAFVHQHGNTEDTAGPF